jgi:3-deoxy-D-manno-octulosonic-acid transferase
MPGSISTKRRTILRPRPASDRPRDPSKGEGKTALALYRGLWGALSPLVPALLRARARQGKEDLARLGERLGSASLPRPQGRLIWIHGASVGESLASLTLVAKLLERPDTSVLVTTGTVTSARLMAERLPPNAIHQYMPVDSPLATKRFLDHWRPDLALFVESELWPNMVLEAKTRGIRLALINARMSERSFRRWKVAPSLARRVLSAFEQCLAQDKLIAERLRRLGAATVKITGSLKVDAAPLPVDEAALEAFRRAIAIRPLFLAASTHPGEEEPLLDVAKIVRQLRPEALTIIVPRHPHRGPDIAAMATAQGFTTERRADSALPALGTQVYVADTLGELGLFYRCTNFAFLGGSLVPHGGQNPLEAARLRTAVITGPHTYNFEEVFAAILAAQGQGRVTSKEQLSAVVSTLVCSPVVAARLGAIAQEAAEQMSGALAATLSIAGDLLSDARP